MFTSSADAATLMVTFEACAWRATLLSASSGALGGLRGLVHLRAILGNIGVIVLPEQVALSAAQDAFASESALKDPKQQSRLESTVRKLADAVKRFHA